MTQPKYKINQTVKVQIFDIITTGTVEQIQERITHFKDGSTTPHVKYRVKTRCDNIMEPWEEDLDLAQTLPLGKMK